MSLVKNKIRFSSYHERGTKKQFWVLTRNRTSDFRFPRSDALPLSHSESVVSNPFIDQLIKLSHQYLELFVVILFVCFCFVFLPDYFILWSVARKKFESRLVNLVDVNIDKLIDGLLIGRSRNMPPMPLVFLWLEMRISRIMRNWLMACVKLPRCCYLHEWLWSPKPTIPSTEFITNEKLVPFWH